MNRLQKKLERVDPPLKPLEIVCENKLKILINQLLNYAKQQGVVNNNYIESVKVFNFFTTVGIREKKVNGCQVFLHHSWDLINDTCDSLCSDKYGYLFIKCDQSGPRRPTYRYNGSFPISYIYGASMPPSSALTLLETETETNNIDVENNSRSSDSNGTAMDIELFSGKLIVYYIFYFNL